MKAKKKIQTRRTISFNREVYDQIKEYCEDQELALAATVQELIEGFLSIKSKRKLKRTSKGFKSFNVNVDFSVLAKNEEEAKSLIESVSINLKNKNVIQDSTILDTQEIDESEEIDE